MAIIWQLFGYDLNSRLSFLIWKVNTYMHRYFRSVVQCISMTMHIIILESTCHYIHLNEYVKSSNIIFLCGQELFAYVLNSIFFLK